MLIRDAELEGGEHADVRLAAGRVAEIGRLPPRPGEPVIAAEGGLLIPGLHDHHIHLAALAASRTSIRCGPPDVVDRAGLAAAIAGAPGADWIRGTAYHEGVAGLPDRHLLDRLCPHRPLRIQHRGGRMWFLNGMALDRLLASGIAPPPGLDRMTGHLFEGDAWMRAAMGSTPPDFAAVGADLARHGVTGLTDMSPANDAAMAAHFAAEQARGALPQRVLLAGAPALAAGDMGPGMTLGPLKLHLHEADLPAMDALVPLVAAAHDAGRPIAIHCATEMELVFALGLLGEAGAVRGDRIEHASVCPDWAVAEIARLGLAVVTQPHFIAERGDAYRGAVPPDTLPLLYRLRAFRAAGVPLGGGSDAPFGGADPWAAMAAAVTRTAPDGATIGADEALTPGEALDLFLRDPAAIDRRRRVVPGAAADLCLLDRPWARMRERLGASCVRATIIAGRIVHDRVDQPLGACPSNGFADRDRG